MSYVTIPPKAANLDTPFARHALSARPRLEDTVAANVLSRLWNKSSHDRRDIHRRSDIRFYISTASESHPIYRIETGEETRAFLHVFRDFSALLFENIDADSARIVPHPLKLSRTFRRRNGSSSTVIVSKQKSFNSFVHICRYTIEEADFVYLDPDCPHIEGALQDAATEIHKQIIAEAKWWLTNAPVATHAKPPIGLAFDKTSADQINLLRQAVVVGFTAAFTHAEVSPLSVSDLGRVNIASPYIWGKSTSITDFQVRVESKPTGSPGEAENLIADFVARAIRAHPDIHSEDFLGQIIVEREIKGQQLTSLQPRETPSAHEAVQAYQELLGWESKVVIIQ